MTTTHRHPSPRRLDVAGLVLTLIGLLCGAFSYWLIDAVHVSFLVIVPSIVATTLGATHLTKREVPPS